MGLSFYEVMSGEYAGLGGRTGPLAFEIRAEASSARSFARTGRARVTGVLEGLPDAPDLPVEGTIHISPVRRRTITYDLAGTDPEGRFWRLTGRKDLSLRHPVEGMTRLAAQLHRDDRCVAEAVLRFDLDDLVPFMGSWHPSSSIRSLDLDPRARVLDADERRLLGAWAQAAIIPGQRVPAPDGRTLDGAEQMLAALPAQARRTWRACLHLVDWLALLRTGHRFEHLTLKRQRAFVKGLADGPAAASGLAFFVGMPLKSAHFERPDYLAAVGVPDFAHTVREPPPRYMTQVTAAEELPPECELECDVVVVGTGAGGGAIAALLAEQNLAVAVLEEGRFHERQAFSGSPQARMRKLWRDAGLTFSLGNVPISIPLGKTVGGTTAINSGTCYRTPDDVLSDWQRRLGFPSDFGPQAMGRHFSSVEAELQVTPGDRRHLGGIADVVARGADQMGHTHYPLDRNAPSCDGQGTCIVGCPTDAKRSTNVSYVPRALQAGAELFTGLPVTRVLRRGRRAVAVEARGCDAQGVRHVLRVRARAVVLACGSLQTPRLLWDSGLDLPRLGRNLSIHPALGMWVRTAQVLGPWSAIPQSYAVEGVVDQRVRFEGFYLPPQLTGPLLPAEGAELTRWMDAQEHVGQFGFMVRDDNVGRVRRGLGGRTWVHYDLDKPTLRRLKLGAAALAELLIRGGGEEVLAGLGPIHSVTTVDQARAIAKARLKPRHFRLTACHPLGTTALGRDPAHGVVDFDHRVFGTDNLYVVDGGCVPTSLGVNPQITIMALATRAAERVGAALA